MSSPLDVYHIENATRPHGASGDRFTVVVAPVKIAGGSGAPARVFALLIAGANVSRRSKPAPIRRPSMTMTSSSRI